MGLIKTYTELPPNVVLTKIDSLLNAARAHSIWPLTFGLACCAIEMISSTTARFDLARFGAEVFRATPRQADVMIVAGTVNQRMVKDLVKLYHQMPSHRRVIAMGSCAISGGPYKGSYNVVQGVDLVVPVDIYVPGCPPRPEALIEGIMKLQRLMLQEGRPSVSALAS